MTGNRTVFACNRRDKAILLDQVVPNDLAFTQLSNKHGKLNEVCAYLRGAVTLAKRGRIILCNDITTRQEGQKTNEIWQKIGEEGKLSF